MYNKPTQNRSKRLVAKLIASAALTVFAIAMPMAANAARMPVVTTAQSIGENTSETGGYSASVSWGGCSACGK